MTDNTPFIYQFGPEFTKEGVVFRLWAPQARSVALDLNGDMYAMSSYSAGWHRSAPQPARAGDAYGFRIDDNLLVPDPASRQQEDDVHGRSLVCPPSAPVAPIRKKGGNHLWPETILYELHTGTFTEEGTFSAIHNELPRLAELGITALELMPVGDFPGRRNWGYDGVLPFAPDRTYGTPEELQNLVRAAHQEKLAVWLDVVYNHFGPDGNYLHVYAPQFFSEDIETPWGPGIDFRRPEVRRFFIENAVYWVREFGIDGLRLDAVHAIKDPTTETGGVHVLRELAEAVRQNAPEGKEVHLVLENDRNQASFLSRNSTDGLYDAQWNDDIHHVFHILLTGETFGYYGDYEQKTEAKLARALAEGYVYQGEVSPGTGHTRGEPSSHLSPTRFVSFLQNHDQIGNRAWGERLSLLTTEHALRAAVAVHILSPQIPLIFMGEELLSTRPFLFFCDFHDELADAVRAGRRKEFGLDEIPDPVDPDTANRCVIVSEDRSDWTDMYRRVLELRRTELVPILQDLRSGRVQTGNDTAPYVAWETHDFRWTLAFNLTGRPRRAGDLPDTDPLYVASPEAFISNAPIPPWTAIVWKEPT